MRFRAESTAVTPSLQIKQSASDGPCDAGSTRLTGLPVSASAAGNRAHEHGAGCSAGRCACPLPRLSPRCIWHRAPAGFVVPVGHDCPHEASLGFVSRWCPARAPCILLGSQPYRRLSGDCTRVLTCVPPVKPGLLTPRYSTDLQPRVTPTDPTVEQCSTAAHQCCRTVGYSAGKLLASANAVSDWNGARQRSEDGGSASWPTNLCWLSRAPIARAVGGELRRDDVCPFHTCG
jgi:hypothetical protein